MWPEFFHRCQTAFPLVELEAGDARKPFEWAGRAFNIDEATPPSNISVIQEKTKEAAIAFRAMLRELSDLANADGLPAGCAAAASCGASCVAICATAWPALKPAPCIFVFPDGSKYFQGKPSFHRRCRINLCLLASLRL